MKRFIFDIFLWLVAAFGCWVWRVAADKFLIVDYIIPILVMMVLWVAVAWLSGMYLSYKTTPLWRKLTALAVTIATTLAANAFLFPVLFYSYSTLSCQTVLQVVLVCDLIVLTFEYYWKYATNVSVPPMPIAHRTDAQCTRPDAPRTPQSIDAIRQSVLSVTTDQDYQLLVDAAHLHSRLTKVVANNDTFSLQLIPNYRYTTIINLALLNNLKGINRHFCLVNQKLPDDGRYVCCFRPQDYVKSKILGSCPKPFNWIKYFFFFLFNRIVPRLVLTSRLYYDLTQGRNRFLSKTEVLGRLYYCGFEVDDCVTMGHIVYVFAHRRSQPYEQQQLKVYGPLIKLRRVGKNREDVYIYKFRTMHPYAEYIQKYVFDQRGGMDIADKSHDDWRITSWGRFMRAHWLDELPMLLNWIRGDVKLVGIRPLSKAMFDTYPPALQEKRTRCKPGLIPPFYIDHPKTMDELFASEEKYLDAYFAHPFLTDCRYFFLTLRSILFKGMRSA